MRSVFFILLLAGSTLLGCAQGNVLPDPEPYFSAIMVSDMDQSLHWYTSIMGFQVLDKKEFEERGLKMANLKRGNMLIELIEVRNSIKPVEILADKEKGSQIVGFFKLGFQVDKFDQWLHFLSELEVDFHGTVVRDPISEKRMVIIKDPDGNRIQIFEK